MIILDAFVVDTNHGCGGALRVILCCEETNETRTVFLDLKDLHSSGISGYVTCQDNPHVKGGE